MNKKGQTTALSVVLVITMLIVIVILSYVWAKSLYDSNKTRATVDYVASKLFEIKNAVLAVSHEGSNSTRIVKLDIPEGNLILKSGAFCSPQNRMGNNSIVFNISTSSELISSDNWVSIDPFESNTSCDAPYENSSIAVLMGRSEKIANGYINSYTMWFRNLTQKNGVTNNFYVINITAGDTTKVGQGSYTLLVRNAGTVNVSYTIYTTVQIDVV